MKRYTASSLENTWGSDESATARAKRGRWSTGPNEDELAVYERFLKKAVKGIDNPRVLVLGATTELRDMAIELGCECLAVDLSPRLITLFHDHMKHKDSDKNHYMKYDWFKMMDLLLPESFDVVLADCSLNNVPAEDNELLLKITSDFLKEGGYSIQRNFMFNPDKKKRELKDFITEYNEGRNTPVGLYLEMVFYSSLYEKSFDKKKKELFWEKFADEIISCVENDLPEKEMAYIKNIAKHAKVHSSIVFTLKEFEDMLKRHFDILDTVKLEKYVYTHGMPIYLLKKK